MTRRALALMAACAVTAVLGASVHAEQAKPHYDAATIKRCQPEENPGPARGTAGGTNATFSPGRFFVPCVTVEQLIYLAYASSGAAEKEQLVNDSLGGPSDDKKVRGGPAWVHSMKEKYQIEATAAGATERTVLMGSMLQALLEDRFQLKIHRETEEMPMFALTVSKSGVKLKPRKDGDCDATAEPPSGLEVPDKPPCGSLMTRLHGPNMLWIFGGIDMDTFTGRLSRPVGLHVIDRTGLTGEFVFRFEFHPDDSTPGIPSSAERDADTSAPPAATLVTALEQQLGLKLEKVTAPRGFIVIDHIERPGPDTFDGGPRYWYKLYHDKTY